MTKICFIDTETTSLRHDRRAWEVALILRDGDRRDVERSWFIDSADLDLGNADPMSLRIGKFYERHPGYKGMGGATGPVMEHSVLGEVERLTRGATIVGAVPNFDTEVLGNRMRANGLCPSWHYHLVDVETLAAGALKMPPPWDFDKLLAAYGLSYDEADRHTALGDARMVRDLYDAVLGKPAESAEDPTTGNCAFCSEPIRYLVNEDRWQHSFGNKGHIASPAPAERLSVGDQP